MSESIFYNGVKLINSRDINGHLPEIYMVDGNRSSGKTTFFSRWFVNRFKKYGEKFILLYRFKNELVDIDNKFFNDIQGLFFKGDVMTSEVKEHGLYVELYLNDRLCGWAVSLNMAYKLKKCSHIFTTATRILFDEFQAKQGEYCDGEIDKFVTLHTSMARGNGQASRYLPVYMISNHISSLNPYYKLFNCCNNADKITNGFVKGDGFVIEKNMNTKIAEIQSQSAFNRACAGSSAVAHTINNTSLCENSNFIEEINTKNYHYVCNIIVDGQTIALKSILDQENVRYYFTNKIDPNVSTRFVISSSDHNDTTLLVGRNFEFMQTIRTAFDVGLIRFSDMVTKDAALTFMLMSIPS